MTAENSLELQEANFIEFFEAFEELLDLRGKLGEQFTEGRKNIGTAQTKCIRKQTSFGAVCYKNRTFEVKLALLLFLCS